MPVLLDVERVGVFRLYERAVRHRRDDAVGGAEQEVSETAQPSRAQFRGRNDRVLGRPSERRTASTRGLNAEARVEFGRLHQAGTELCELLGNVVWRHSA